MASPLLIVILTLVQFSCGISRNCSLYIAPSLLRNFGNGVFAGTSFSKDATVESGVSVLFGEDLFAGTQLENYAYASHDARFAVCVLGAGMIFNHLENPNLNPQFEGPSMDIQVAAIRPYSMYNPKLFVANRDLGVGEELFSNYGGENWFSERHISYDKHVTSSRTYTAEELARVGHCLSDVYVADSTIPMAGRGVFASRDFAAGELVSVSPTLVLPRHIIEQEGTTSLLLNYVMSEPQSDIAVFPFGRASLCNHMGGNESNLEVRWSAGLQGGPVVADPQSDPVEALRTESGPKYLAFYARSPIRAGQELTIDYGSEWETEWAEYVALLERWLALYEPLSSGHRRGKYSAARAPQFRHFIGAPAGLFPKRWGVTGSCVGAGCNKRKRRGQLQKTYSVSNELEQIRASRQRMHELREDYPCLLNSLGSFLSSTISQIISNMESIRQRL